MEITTEKYKPTDVRASSSLNICDWIDHLQFVGDSLPSSPSSSFSRPYNRPPEPVWCLGFTATLQLIHLYLSPQTLCLDDTALQNKTIYSLIKTTHTLLSHCASRLLPEKIINQLNYTYLTYYFTRASEADINGDSPSGLSVLHCDMNCFHMRDSTFPLCDTKKEVPTT